MNEQTFLRDENHLYLIAGSPSDYYTGRTCDGSQVLIVPSFPNLITVFFDPEGNLLRVEEHPLTDSLQTSHESRITEDTATGALLGLKSLFCRVGYQEGIIQVKRFFLNDHTIGIRDFPESFIDMIRSPTRYCKDEVTVANNELDRWSKEGVFELCLSADSNRWIEKSGMIESS